MAKKVYVDVIVDDKGTTKKVAVDAKKVSKALGETATASATVRRGYQGVAQAGANTTKNFSKMAGTLQGTLVPAYATVAATVFAATAVFNNFQKAAQVDNLAKGLDAIGAASGRNLSQLAMQLREATQGAISLEQALRSTALASSGGVSGDEFVRLGKVARNASVALGRDLTDSLDRLTRGVTKLEPEILDELGIIVRVDEASEKYAAGLGKTASQLTNLEKRQAFLNEVLDQGEAKFGAIGETIPVDGFTKLSATVQDALKSFSSFLNIVAEPLAGIFAELPGILLAFGAAFASVVLKAVIPSLGNIAEESAKVAKEASDNLAGIQKEQQKIFGKENKNRFKELESVLESQNKSLSKGLLVAKKTKDIDEARLVVSSSLEARQKILNTGKVAGNNLTAQGRIELERVVATQQQLLSQIDQEIVKRDRLAGLSAKASAKASAAGATSTIITGLDDPTLTGGEKLKNTIKGLKDIGTNTFNTLTESAKKTKKGLTTMNLVGIQSRVIFTALGATAKVVGNLLLRVIPYVGPILLGLQLLTPIIKAVAEATGLWNSEASELNKTALEQAEASRKQAKAASDQIKVQQKLIQKIKEEKEEKGNLLKIARLENEINKIETANNTQRSKDLLELTEKAKKYAESVGFIQKAWDKITGGSDVQNAVNEATVAQVARAGDESALKFIESIRSQFKENSVDVGGLFGAEELLSSIQGAQDLADKSEEISRIIGYIRNEGGIPAAIGVAAEYAKVQQDNQAIIESGEKLVSIQQSLAEDSKAVETAFKELRASSAISTEYDELSTSLNSITNAFADFDKLDIENKPKQLLGLIVDLDKNIPDLDEKLGLKEGVVDDAIISEDLGKLEAVQRAVETYANSIDLARKNAVSLKTNLERISTIQKEIANLSKFSIEALRLSQRLAEKELQTQIEIKNEKLQTLSAAGEPTAQIQKEIFNLTLKQKSEEQQTLEIQKTGLELSKQERAIEQKILQAKTQKAQADQKSIEARAKLAQLAETGSTELDPKRQLEVGIKSAELALKTARTQNELKLQQIDAETAIQKTQFKILEAEAVNLKAKLKSQALEIKDTDPEGARVLESAAASLEGVSFTKQIAELDTLAEAQKSAAKSVLESAELQFQVSIADAFRGAFENNEIYQTFASNLQSNLTSFFKGETTIGEAIGGALIATLEKKAETLLADAFKLFENDTAEKRTEQIMVDNGIKINENTKATDRNTEAKLRESQAPASVQGPGDATVPATVPAVDAESAIVNQVDAESAIVNQGDTSAFGGTFGAIKQLFKPKDAKTTIEGNGEDTFVDVKKSGLGKRLGNVFGSFTDDIKGLFSKEGGFLKGLGDIFSGGLEGFSGLFDGIGSALQGLFKGGGEEGGGLLSGIVGMVGGMFGAPAASGAAARRGGIFETVPGYATGGVARGREAGYPAVLHGTEAVVPLPNGKEIPVQMQGGAQNTNNVAVNVNMADNQIQNEPSGDNMAQFGNAIVSAVQREIADQTRPGGLLAR